MSGHYCGPVEFLLRAGQEWRDMSDDVFEANLKAFETEMRRYREQTAKRRATLIPWRPGTVFA